MICTLSDKRILLLLGSFRRVLFYISSGSAWNDVMTLQLSINAFLFIPMVVLEMAVAEAVGG